MLQRVSSPAICALVFERPSICKNLLSFLLQLQGIDCSKWLSFYFISFSYPMDSQTWYHSSILDFWKLCCAAAAFSSPILPPSPRFLLSSFPLLHCPPPLPPAFFISDIFLLLVQVYSCSFYLIHCAFYLQHFCVSFESTMLPYFARIDYFFICFAVQFICIVQALD